MKKDILKDLLAKPGKKHLVSDFDSSFTGDLSKRDAKEQLAKDIEKLSELQSMLYAQDRYSILIIFQAMDAAGKDGTIKHVMSGINPQGCQVYSFKQPSAEELDHDYLWRINRSLPERGRIGIFNRSHYEDVLIAKVHPEIILSNKLPGVETVNDIDPDFWKRRYRQINDFERYLTENGTIVLKFFLNVSKAEQKNRFMERLDDGGWAAPARQCQRGRSPLPAQWWRVLLRRPQSSWRFPSGSRRSWGCAPRRSSSCPRS